MEQKAVVYKNLKGMSRDMSVSSGNNDFSYENYNIRITTRGKEDSLIVTNEKGTESNIIATKDFLKTVNNVFVGMQPGFYNDFTELEQSDDIRKYEYTELYKNVGTEQNPEYVQLTQEEYFNDEIVKYKRVKQNEIQQLTSANGIIKYSLNTEYPTYSDLKAKGIFSITETPITYKDEKLYLLNDGKYSTDTQIIIPENNNTFLATQNIRDIVLDGDSSETATDVEDIKNKKWLDTYKNLYRRIIEKNFEFSGFDARMNDISYVTSENLSQIPVDIISSGLTLPTGEFTPNDIYAGGSGTISGSGTEKHLKIDIPKVSYLIGNLFTNNYPTNATLKINKSEYVFYLPLFRKNTNEAFSSTRKYYKGLIITKARNEQYHVNAGNISGYEVVNPTESDISKYWYICGYLKAIFDFDVKIPFGNNITKKSISLKRKIDDGPEEIVSNVTADIIYGFYSTTNPNSAVFNMRIKGNPISSNSAYDDNTKTGIVYYNPEGPFWKSVINEIEDTSQQIDYNNFPDIKTGYSINAYKVSNSSVTKILFVSNSYFKADGSNISSATDGTNNGYRFKNNGTEQEPKYDYKTVEHISNNKVDATYSVISYELTSAPNSNNYVEISKIETKKDTEGNYLTDITIGSLTLTYNKLDNTISNGNTKYYIYSIEIDRSDIPYIIYSTEELENITEETQVYQFTGSAFEVLLNGVVMLPSSLIGDKVQLKTDSYIYPDGSGDYSFQYTESNVTHTINISKLDRVNYLPIFETGGYTTITISSESDFNAHIGDIFTRSVSTPYVYTPATNYVSGTQYYTTLKTEIDSIAKVLFESPTYNQVVGYFGFRTNNFKSSISVQEFRLKRSNNNWDDKYVYNFLSENSDFVDYTKKFIPMSVLDTNMLSLRVEKTDGFGYTNFFIDIKNPDNEYFGLYNKQIDIVIGDNSNKHYEFTSTLSELENGVSDARYSNVDLDAHTFYIKSIKQQDIPSDEYLELEDIKDNIGFEDVYKGDYKVTLQIFKGKESYAGKKYARQIVDYGSYQTTSTIEFSFGNTYLNKFYSPLSNDLLIANFDKYQALTIPGRILGSCTIDDYVVLFFHYSSPALNWYYYDTNDKIYVLLAPNADVSQYDKLYTRNTKFGFDLAAVNSSLLRDDNNDYINGKNQDYIVKLKYIDARPDNKENEWATIVEEIVNAATQSGLHTDITEKRPYYSADILYHGNLKFNANNGIETIGFYESKDVIKVYFTDGRNQPRMIDIMTPFAQRNGLRKKWDSKSFDFIQEISGNEKCEITKQFGGGAFPAGSVQYYFTYSNLGGCETNPFISTPLYYSSESETGNSPMKITDNTFKIKLTNLSTRFDYVNIYSVVRSTKDAQPYCKKVIYLSLNGKTEVEFTDNNLLGETVDHNYLLMLQGTPISALTFAEKDNTLFLGNINKLQNNISQEDKDKIKSFFEVQEGMREYQNYNPNEENWYENKVKDKVKLDYYGNKVIDAQGERIIDSKISLEENSSEIKTFMYNEYYRLGIQLQDKFGKWSDPIFIKDVKCELPIETNITEKNDENENITNVTNITSNMPYFYMTLKNEFVNEFKNILNDYGYIKIRPVIVYPNISSRNVLCQGLLNPTMFNYAERSINGPFNFNSYFFRPIPPAISTLKNEEGESYHNVNRDDIKVCGSIIENRHCYPIGGWHDAIEEGLAKSQNPSGEDVKTLVNTYLTNINSGFVRLTSNTPGWWIDTHRYLRDGEVELQVVNSKIQARYKVGGRIYKVDTDKNKGSLEFFKTISGSDMIDLDYPKGGTENVDSQGFRDIDSFNNFLGKANNIASTNIFNNFLSKNTTFKNAFGFKSHMHYFKSAWLQSNPFTLPFAIVDSTISGNEIIKPVGNTNCEICGGRYLVFTENNLLYYVDLTSKCTIKIISKKDVRMKKHRGLKRKTYFVDLKIISDNIKVVSDTNYADAYIDKPDGSDSIETNKAYFAFNDGELQCANGFKEYNLYENGLSDKIDLNYDSSEISVDDRKQSLFYIDESILTLNSPEIEYDPTVQKIDLSTYKLNIIGAANITGYANKIDIDTETPPATAGTTVCEGFKGDYVEVQNFNREAYRYFLSGGYWYDNVFYEGDEEVAEKKCDSADLISDQYCWWVYPFNRQILNNSKEGANGKLRTKKWVNYHYSAFSDYFGKASTDYQLLDAQQIRTEFTSANIDTNWTNKKCMYFGSVDTAYVKPVPLVGILGGSNDPDENSFEQPLAISPHTEFKGHDSYSSVDYADIVPVSFNSSNHFVLSLKDYKPNYNSVLPEYYSNALALSKDDNAKTITKHDTYYRIVNYFDVDTNNFIELQDNYYVKTIPYNETQQIYIVGESGVEELENSTLAMSNIGDGLNIINIPNIAVSQVQASYLKNNNIPQFAFFAECSLSINDSSVDVSDDFEQVNGSMYTFQSEYKIQDSLLKSPRPSGCVRKYIEYKNENAGLYKYGHIYIAQLERGVKSADEVFNGTSESVLLQNTWIPAGEALSIDEFANGENVKWTEGDTFYQRYDCLKTFAYSDSSVNQIVEQLSAMIQTRINLDGIYSYRGNVDNTGANNTNTNILNQAYSQSDNYFSYTITDPYIADITEYSNMLTWTLTKQAMSRNDNWLAVNLISFYNATGSFGKITRLINYRNQLFCFQDNAISQIAYNERVALSASDGVPVEIGNSGKVQGLNYISSNVGCQNRWSVVPSKSFLYWVDDRRAEIYRFGEGLEPFSTANGFSDWVKDNTYGEDWKPIKSTNVPITAYYDNNNDDIYFVTEKDCLAYNEKLNAFESFFSYEDSFILNSAGNTLVIKEQDAYIRDLDDITDVHDENDSSWWDNGIRGDGLSSIELMHEGNYNQFFGDYKPYYLRFKVYPTDMQRDKIYTNLEFNTDAFDEKDIYLPNGTFTRVRVWNEYQWGQMYFDSNSNPYGTTNFRKRFRTFYAQLPRASYVPTGFYDDYYYLFNRQPQWRLIDALLTTEYHGNVSTMNDRIRNPWVWMELYKNPKDKGNFEPYTFEAQDEEGRILEYLNNKSTLYFERYDEVDSNNWINYEYLYMYDENEEDYVVTHDYSNTELKLFRLEYVNCSNYLIFDSEKTYYVLNVDNNRMEIHDIILKYFEA